MSYPLIILTPPSIGSLSNTQYFNPIKINAYNVDFDVEYCGLLSSVHLQYYSPNFISCAIKPTLFTIISVILDKMDSTCETLPLRSASGATFARCKNAAAWPLHQLSPSSFGRLKKLHTPNGMKNKNVKRKTHT